MIKKLFHSLLGRQNTAPRIKQLKQDKLDRLFIGIACDFSELSHCVSQHVACLFVLDNRIIATGINGTAEGEVNCDELFPAQGFDAAAHRTWSDMHEIHAELNALIWAGRRGISLEGATVYSSLQPCSQCLKNLIPLKVKRIVFERYYNRVTNNDEVVKRLIENGIEYKWCPIDPTAK
ncbi:MAG: deaminase [Candidatus Nitrosotenuis sp.]